MASRIDRYDDEVNANSSNRCLSRASKNSKLYTQIQGNRYNDLDNLPMADNTDEIDMDKLKELLDVRNKGKGNERSSEYSGDYKINMLESRKKNIDNKKVYDINKLLEKAKYENNKIKEPESKIVSNSRNILSTLEESELSSYDIKKEYEKYKKNNGYGSNKLDEQSNTRDYDDLPITGTREIDLEKTRENKLAMTRELNLAKKRDNDLSMTREMKYHTRNISLDPMVNQVISDNDLSLELLNDLKPTGNTMITEPVKNDSANDKVSEKTTEDRFFPISNTSDIDTLKEDIKKNNNSNRSNDKMDQDFFTSSYEFSDKDFGDDFADSKGSSILKIILLIIAIIVFAGVIFYFVMNYGIN